MLTLSVLLSTGQCINRVMRLVVWGGVGGYERCMTSWCMREHCMFEHWILCLFLVLAECVVELCVVLVLVYCHFMYSGRTWVVCYCTVSEIGGTLMTVCTFHYRMERPH